MFQALFRNKLALVILIFTGIMALLTIGVGFFILAPDISQIGNKNKNFSLEQNKYPVVTSVEPEEYVLLTPGMPGIFRVNFRTGVDVTTLRATLTQSLDANPKVTKVVPITTSFDILRRSVIVTTENPIIPVSTYTLSVQNPRTTTLLMRINYHSGRISPTPVVSNNPTLEQFLPHITDSYTLSYNKERNIYIFNFKIDPESDLSIATQYDIAKTNATRFIESKGVPLNTITIEWKRY